MDNVNRTPDRLLQLVRESYKDQPGDLSASVFFQRLWAKLEVLNDPGIVKPAPNQYHPGRAYLYEQAPFDLQAAAHQAMYRLLHSDFVFPKPTGDFQNFSRSEWYQWTERGLEWVAGTKPVPEDAVRYLKFLKELVPSIDDVILQYILEALEAFNRDAYFATAVMMGAASEKAVYLLAESLLISLKPSVRRADLEKALTRRSLFSLLDSARKTIEDGSVGKTAPIPYSLSEGATSHLLSLFEAVRTQRNDAVHPMNAVVSAASVRLLLQAFPYALATTERIRMWAVKNPACM